MKLVLLVSVGLLSTIEAYLSYPSSTRHKSHLACTASPENNNLVDDYYDMLNLLKPVQEDDLAAVVKESTITGESSTGLAPRRLRKTKSSQMDWEHWDAFLEDELGDLDAELRDDQKWVLDAREIIEQRRGVSIWSKKEVDTVKKTPVVKTLFVPEAVASIVTSVYIEKTRKLSDVKKEDQLGYITFRKFMVDLKKRSKKDPIMQSKLEVSKKWLTQKPRCNSIRKNELPKVVMDECREPVQNVIFEIPKPSADTAASSSSSSNAVSPIKTFSMINWDMKRNDMPASLVGSIPKPVDKAMNSTTKFMVDNEEIFTVVSDEYFVVL